MRAWSVGCAALARGLDCSPTISGVRAKPSRAPPDASTHANSPPLAYVLASAHAGGMSTECARSYPFKLSEHLFQTHIEGQVHQRTCGARAAACSTLVLTRVWRVRAGGCRGRRQRRSGALDGLGSRLRGGPRRPGGWGGRGRAGRRARGRHDERVASDGRRAMNAHFMRVCANVSCSGLCHVR